MQTPDETMNAHPLPQHPIARSSDPSACIENRREYNLSESGDETRQKPQATDLHVSGGGFQVCAPDYQETQTIFEGFALNFIASGKGRMVLNGEESVISSGSLFAIQPKSTYQVLNDSDASLVLYRIHFSGEQASRLVEKTFLSNGRPHNLSRLSWVKETFVNIQECGEDATASAQTACELLLEYLFTRLEHTKLPDAESHGLSFSVFENCRNYIENFFSSINGAHEIASATNISHQYLCYLFKRFSKETPTQMLLRLKLNRSAELLAKGNLLIKEIAQEVGFEDQYYFSKRFKDYFGLSPRNYISREREKISA